VEAQDSLFIVVTGNIDGAVSPSDAQLESWLARPGHPTT